MTLGEGLRKIRKGNKYTLTDVSKLADISVPHLSTMECDKVNVSVAMLCKLATAYSNPNAGRCLRARCSCNDVADVSFKSGTGKRASINKVGIG